MDGESAVEPHKLGSKLAKKLKVDPSRVNEIVKYRIDLYTVARVLPRLLTVKWYRRHLHMVQCQGDLMRA